MNKLRLLILVVFLAGCSPGMFLADGSRPGDVLYQDSFSDSSSGWDRSTTEVGSLDYFDGTYHIKVDRADYDLWSVTGSNYRDVRLEVDAARFGGPQENRFGLICRYRDALDFYFFIISSDGYYAIGRVSAGTHSLLGQPMMAFNMNIINEGDPIHLRFDCVDSTLTGYVNGQMVAITQDGSFSEGDVGLIAGSFDVSSVEIVFDDFMVLYP